MNSLLSSLRAAAVAAIFVSVVDVSAVAATNLVTNGGFETGNFSGWTQSGNTGFTGVETSSAASGTYGAFFGPVGSPGYISQTLSTLVGATYDLSFMLQNYSGGFNGFEVSWNGTVVDFLIDSDSFAFVQRGALGLVATSATTTLTFGFQNDPSYWTFDDVSVVERSRVSGVPDASSTVALLGLALALVAGVRRWLA